MQFKTKSETIRTAISMPTPNSISYWWNFGSLLGLFLVLQIISGLLLSVHYISSVQHAFDSIVHICRDVSGGFFLRSMHANGASIFFCMLYLHIGRGLYYKSFMSQTKTWLIGITILLVSMGIAFLGYVLPWGQMSYWGATVITNLLSAFPLVGPDLVKWVWGGFSVDQATLSRFFVLHFLLPFVVAGLSMIHLLFLHENGSSNPLGLKSQVSKITFHPYFTLKDMVGFSAVFSVFLWLVFVMPFLLQEPQNFMSADIMVTPPHIQPEWYFLFAYAILRAVPNKLGGVLAMFMSILVLGVLVLRSNTFESAFDLVHKITVFTLTPVFLLLTWVGACEVEQPFILLSQILSVMYFLCFFIMVAGPLPISR